MFIFVFMFMFVFIYLYWCISTSIYVYLCLFMSTVKVPLSQPCFDHFFGPCFRGHDEAGLLAFEALQGLPRPARGTRTKRGSRGLESI